MLWNSTVSILCNPSITIRNSIVNVSTNVYNPIVNVLRNPSVSVTQIKSYVMKIDA